MSREDYKRIIDEFCDLADIDDVASVFENGLLRIGHTPVRLDYLDAIDMCRIAVDLGTPAGGYQPGLYRLMLESNFTHIGESMATLTIEPASGHAVMVAHVPLQRLLTDLPLGFVLGEQLEPVLQAWRALIEEVELERSAQQAQQAAPEAAPGNFI